MTYSSQDSVSSPADWSSAVFLDGTAFDDGQIADFLDDALSPERPVAICANDGRRADNCPTTQSTDICESRRGELGANGRAIRAHSRRPAQTEAPRPRCVLI